MRTCFLLEHIIWCVISGGRLHSIASSSSSILSSLRWRWWRWWCFVTWILWFKNFGRSTEWPTKISCEAAFLFEFISTSVLLLDQGHCKFLLIIIKLQTRWWWWCFITWICGLRSLVDRQSGPRRSDAELHFSWVYQYRFCRNWRLCSRSLQFSSHQHQAHLWWW